MAPSLSKPWYPVETYCGQVISQRGRTFRVGDVRVKSIHEARALIDQSASSLAQDHKAVLQQVAESLALTYDELSAHFPRRRD